MTPAVERLIAQRVEQGHPERVTDPRALRVAVAVIRRSSTPVVRKRVTA